MARADLLVHLVRAARQRDDGELDRTVESLIAEERDKQHHLLAERLENALHTIAPASNGGGHVEPGAGFAVLTPRQPLDDLFLPDVARAAVEELIEEQQRTEVLRAHALEPRHRILLTGPPGNGKTSLGEAIAEALLLPLVLVRYEEVIGSFLGETAGRLAAVFAFARTRRCVLFFDEFDAIGKERGDEHETGEIKRVVSSLLLNIDALPSYVVVVAATNHAELLDRAVWRRFQLRLELPLPDRAATVAWIKKFEARSGVKLGLTAKQIDDHLAGLSYAELEDFCANVQRRLVLDAPKTELQAVVASRLAQLRARFRPRR
jgi:SpoVK/Ycf46/Vps4 family AAA+-type ATPase